MTEETAVARFDYSKPPPGYAVEHSRRTHDFRIRVGWWWKNIERWVAGSLGDAWVHYKGEHDPPGMVVESTVDDEDDAGASLIWHIIERITPNVVWWRGYPDTEAGERDGESAARAAAWSWYGRRLALWEKLALAEGVQRTFIADDVWPATLTWSEEQVAEVERWLVDNTAEMPEVLGG